VPTWLLRYRREWLRADIVAGLIRRERRRPAGRCVRTDRGPSSLGRLDRGARRTACLRPARSTPKFEFTRGKIVKVVFDVADDAYVDVERELTAAIARD
jgi:hypothetical protein